MRLRTARRPRGRHRFVMTRARLRRWCHHAECTANRLARALVVRTLERDGARAERDDARAALAQAVIRIAGLEEQVRAVGQLREDNTALRAKLATRGSMHQAARIRSAPDPDEETVPTDVRRVRPPTAHGIGPTMQGWRVMALPTTPLTDGATHIPAAAGREP